MILAIDTTGYSASVALLKNGKEVIFCKTQKKSISRQGRKADIYDFYQDQKEFILQKINSYKLDWKKIKAIAVSAFSGYYNSIIIGRSIADTLGETYKKPVICVDHILAHQYSTWIERESKQFNFPVLNFCSSGSHSDLSIISKINKYQSLNNKASKKISDGNQKYSGVGRLYYRIGKNLLKGVCSEKKLANCGTEKVLKYLFSMIKKGNPKKYNFEKYYKGSLFDLDFTEFRDKICENLEEKNKSDFAASFQYSLVKILIDKLIKISKLTGCKEIHIGGGISMNEYFENKLKREVKNKQLSIKIRFPLKKEYKLDNAAMIGCLAYYQKKYKIKFNDFYPSITI